MRARIVRATDAEPQAPNRVIAVRLGISCQGVMKAGTVIGACKRRHRSTAFRAFLDQVEAAVPAALDVHLVPGNITLGATLRGVPAGWFGGCPRSEAPRRVRDEAIAELITLTLEEQPQGVTHWPTRSMARRVCMSQTMVSRIWRAFGLQPHRTEVFKLSRDPAFVDKVRDLVGLYLNPPDHALVLCLDEKPQIQAVEETAPVLPMRPGQVWRHSHDYKRHGTTDLCAALDAATHKTRLIHDWLLKRPRWYLHFTPTSASWLNPGECWFSLLPRRCLQRSASNSTGALEAAIQAYIEQTNAQPRPFVWTRTADEVLASLKRSVSRRPTQTTADCHIQPGSA